MKYTEVKQIYEKILRSTIEGNRFQRFQEYFKSLRGEILRTFMNTPSTLPRQILEKLELNII